MATALIGDPFERTTADRRPKTSSRQYSGERNSAAKAPSAGREGGEDQGAHDAGEKEASAAIESATPARPVPRHLVPVEAGDDRGRLARHVDKDRRRRSAVLGAVVDARQHDDGGDRIESEGDGQEHGDRRDGSDTGQHADQRSEDAPEEAEEDVGRSGGDAEPHREIVDKVHVTTRTAGAAGSGRR